MDNKIELICGLQDWNRDKNKKIPNGVRAARNMNASSSNDMGLYIDDKNYYHTSGIVGIGWLKNQEGKIFCNSKNGKKVALKVIPRFELEPWDMLAKVMNDPEYELYEAASDLPFYEIFWDDEMIEAPTEEKGGDLLLAISFIKSCQSICRKHVKSQMAFQEGNLNGKLLGSLMISKQIKYNVVQGREDRLYCKYPVFTIDTLENRILKSAVHKAEKIIKKNNFKSKEIISMVTYCKTSLRNVNFVHINKSDFSKTNVTGFNSYYKQAIDLSKLILNNIKINDLSDNENNDKKKIIPYAIRMESLFEFYVRSSIKMYLEKNKMNFSEIVLDEYRSPRINPLSTLKDRSNNVYLMKSYIPDIALKKKYVSDTGEVNSKYIAVFDVKYQNYTNSVYMNTQRHNSHQLLFYMLLLNVTKCGFIFPTSRNNKNETIKSSYQILFQEGNADNVQAREYTQWNYETHEENNISMIEKLIRYSADI